LAQVSAQARESLPTCVGRKMWRVLASAALAAFLGGPSPAAAVLLKKHEWSAAPTQERRGTRGPNASDVHKPLLSAAAHNSSINTTSGVWPSVLAPYGVVHFLFLVNGALPHAGIWKMFFAEAPRRSWRAYVHCKDPEACKKSGLPLELPEVKMISTVGSWYCHDLVTAMVHMLKTALDESPANGGAGAVEKFVFVSDTTLPVKPFSEVHSALTSTDDSDLCMFPQDQWAWATIDNHYVRLVKHHQWVVLNREHSEIMVKEWKPVDARGVWEVPLKGGSWAAQGRVLSPQHFNRSPNSNWCTDEWAFYATIFGAFEPDASGGRTYPGLGYVSQNAPQGSSPQGRCRTFTYWDNNGADFQALGGQIASDSSSRMSCYPKCWQHPAELQQLSPTSLTYLRNSPFLFARKMSPSLWMPDYYGLVFNQGGGSQQR